MKPILIIATAAAIALAACSKVAEQKSQQSLMEQSRQELVNAINERNELLALVKDISKSMNQLKRLENIVSADTAANDSSARVNILKDINLLHQTIRTRKQDLISLEIHLSKSMQQNEELLATIAELLLEVENQIREIEGLKSQLSDARQQIGRLSLAVDSLGSSVAEIEAELDTARAVSMQFETELNTCYYVIASKSKLKEHNILEERFLRKSKLLKGNFNQEIFRTADQRLLDTIPTYVENIKILTNHPERSYKIAQQNGFKILIITNPEKFWSLTNYLVVQSE